jgi:hypothetical protein
VKVIRPEPATAIRTTADLQKVLARMKSGDYVSLLVYSVVAKGTRVVNLRIAE